jgi:hypothetical protein
MELKWSEFVLMASFPLSTNCQRGRHGERCYDPETLQTLRAVLDEAWPNLTSAQRSRSCKSEMAMRILNLAESGIRDPAKLRTAAVSAAGRKDQPERRAEPVRRKRACRSRGDARHISHGIARGNQFSRRREVGR